MVPGWFFFVISAGFIMFIMYIASVILGGFCL
jgi:hypothetical protein